MTELQTRIIDQLITTRDTQDRRWGGPLHDDLHTPFDWIAFIEKQTRELFLVAEGVLDSEDSGAYEARLVAIGALALAALESAARQLAWDPNPAAPEPPTP